MAETAEKKIVPTTRVANPELQALAKIDVIMTDLSLEAEIRVVQWLVSHVNERAAEVQLKLDPMKLPGV